MVAALGAIFTSWAGCASGDSTTTTGSTSSAGGTGGATSSSSSSSGTGGSTGGTGGTMGCAGNEKACGEGCVKVDDPAYGCSVTGCEPCTSLPHAQAACAGGVCVFSDCEAGFENCDGNDGNGCETDVTGDPQQCGACGSPCVVPDATATCVNGKCEVGTCDVGYVDCNGDPLDGCEAQPDTDPNNCGICGKKCAGGEGCEMGVCGVYCAKGKGNCDGDPLNGCETPFGTLTDCAFCGDECAPENAQASCDTEGVCTLTECNTGWANCDMTAANGCEINTGTDAGNCGSCGNVCPSGPHSTAACENGGCVLHCAAGWDDCDNNPSNGCETHTDVDAGNCGSCDHACNTPNAAPACAAGLCVVSACNQGFADCDTSPANGCEINTTNNASNCGGCGMGCSIANGTAACVGSMCAVGTCAPGFADCDGQVSNGCETNTAADTGNCGGCGNACNLPHAAPACTGGICTVGACNPGFQNCNNIHSDGCEVNTDGDPLHCGSCTNQCFTANGTPGCSGGSCTVGGCNAGFDDCNGFPQDGCETDINGSLAHCGSCGNNCQTSCTGNVTATACNAGSCQVLGCGAGFFNVDGVCGNGCECQTSATSSACLAPTAIQPLQVGQTRTFTGNLVPAGQEAWLTVTFNGNTNYGYHPHIQMTAGATEFVFDVLVNCSGGAISCGFEGGNSVGKTDWETFYSAGDPNDPPHFIPIPPVGNAGAVLIHVYRRAGKPVSCAGYTLTISN